MLKRLNAAEKKRLLDKLRSRNLYKRPENKYAHLSEAELIALDDETLIDALDNERRQFVDSNEARKDLMVNELVRRKIYPARGFADKFSARQMMEGWGVHWYKWRGPLNCPHCNADLRDLENGPPFKLEIGVYDQRRDCTTHYQCRECNKEFPRRMR